jgi:poly-beta-1,6-N-acetyl-D-glucosamine synthase
MSRYIIITPAHNEEDFLEETIQSMVAQIALPVRWVIVDDASTDRTGPIIADWAKRYPFIQHVTLRREQERNFARKAIAFNAGLKEIQGLDYEYIGCVDADMSFGGDYFRNILLDFEADPKLGISGGIVYTKYTDKFVTYDTTVDSVGGKVQLFRRACFESVGGYIPLKHGGIDTAAEIMARMNGWVVRKSFKEKTFEHRRTSFAWGTPLKAKAREGSHFHSLGYDPLFYFMRCMYRLKEYPFVLGSLSALAGYIGRMARREPFTLPTDVVRYLRREQRAKLRKAFGLGTGRQ